MWPQGVFLGTDAANALVEAFTGEAMFVQGSEREKWKKISKRKESSKEAPEICIEAFLARREGVSLTERVLAKRSL